MAKKTITTYDLYTGNIPEDLKSQLGSGFLKNLQDSLSGQTGNPFEQGTQASNYFTQVLGNLRTGYGTPNSALSQYDFMHSFQVPEQQQLAAQYGSSYLKNGVFYSDTSAITPEEVAQKVAESKRIEALNASSGTMNEADLAIATQAQAGMAQRQATETATQQAAITQQSATQGAATSNFRTLIDIANSRADVLNTAKSLGGDPFTAGTKANDWLNNWWNTAGKNEYPNVTLVQPGDSRLGTTTGVSEPAKIDQSLIDIVNARADVLATAKAQGGDPFTAGTKANTWLNNWWNTTGKLEYPNVNLVSPGADLTGNNAVGTSAEAIKATEEENRKKAEETQKKIQDLLDEKDKKQSTAEGLALDLEIERLTKELEAMKTPTLDASAAYGKLISEYDITGLQTKLNTADKSIADLKTAYKNELIAQEGGLASMETIGIRQSAITTNYNRQMDTLVNERNSIVNELNTKNTLISNIMEMKKLDYQVASDTYSAEYKKQLDLINLLQGEQTAEANTQSDIITTAKANYATITNIMKSENVAYADLSTSLQYQIAQLEAQQGLPVGITEALFGSVADATEIVGSPITSYDASGNQIVTYLYKDSSGSIKVAEAQYTGGYNKPSGSTKEEDKGITVKEAISEMSSIIANDIGIANQKYGKTFKYVNSTMWKQYKAQWQAEGLDVSDFIEQFSQYIQPDNAKEYGNDEYVYVMR